MAISVEVTKNSQEDDEYVFYNYKFSYAGETYINNKGKARCKRVESEGLIKINKATGEVVVKQADGDKGAFVRRAAWALMRSWTNGEFPEKTYWVS